MLVGTGHRGEEDAMDWQERMTAAVDYLEGRLYGEADMAEAAAAANCSSFHFMRMFEVVTGMGPGEYLRRRRLSEAARLLSSGGEEKVIELAMRYGYESPDAFSRAFRREFGCLPTEARRRGARLHSYPRLTFSVVLKGDEPMEYRIEEMPAMELAGIGIRISSKGGENYDTVPAFWDGIMKDGRFKALCANGDAGRMGICGVCRDFDMAGEEFTYSIAVDAPADPALMPAGSERFAVPASTWGKFTSRGPLRPNFQATIKRVFSEWMPAATGWEHAGTAEIEYYPEGDPDSEGYFCEYWLPLRRAGAGR
jgi:AraC family transcriptional regulator